LEVVHLLLWGYSTLHSGWKLLCNYKPELLVYGNTQQGLGTFTVFSNHESQRRISLNQWWGKLHAKIWSESSSGSNLPAWQSSEGENWRTEALGIWLSHRGRTA
jgi:hypothetical protein